MNRSMASSPYWHSSSTRAVARSASGSPKLASSQSMTAASCPSRQITLPGQKSPWTRTRRSWRGASAPAASVAHHVAPDVGRRQVRHDRDARVFDRLERGERQRSWLEGVETDQEPGHLVQGPRQVGGGDVGRTVDPLHEEVRRAALVSSYRYGSGTARPSRCSAVSTACSLAVTVRSCCLNSARCWRNTTRRWRPSAVAISSPNTFADTPPVSARTPTSRPPGSSVATACSIPDGTSTARTLGLPARPMSCDVGRRQIPHADRRRDRRSRPARDGARGARRAAVHRARHDRRRRAAPGVAGVLHRPPLHRPLLGLAPVHPPLGQPGRATTGRPASSTTRRWRPDSVAPSTSTAGPARSRPMSSMRTARWRSIPVVAGERSPPPS